MSTRPRNNILVIKLSALGDFIQALGPMAAIRRAHPDDHITLLTTKFFKNFAEQCGYFDHIIIDDRPKALDIKGWLKLRKNLKSGDFNRVYDLQNNDRTSLYFKLLSKKPEWVGTAKGVSHRNVEAIKKDKHAFERHAQTLALAGIQNVTVDKLEWMKEDISGFALEKPYVLLVPGCAPNRPEKRWPAEKYGQLANMLKDKGVQPVIIGTKDEQEAVDTILKACPSTLNLMDQTSFYHITTLAREAAGAIGNDTGPMHMIGATGAKCIVLFSQASDTIKHAPKGDHVTTLQKEHLKDLKAEDVIAQLKE
jgi:ADP-heptose:LPS heptosyltransferase